MALSIIVFAGLYPPASRAIQYADLLAEAVGGRLVLLHVNRASLFGAGERAAQGHHQQELAGQTATTARLYQQAEGLRTTATVEVATDPLPAVAQDLARRYQPALFVLSQAAAGHPAANLVAAAAELLRAGSYPLLVVAPAAPAAHPPRRILIAADREPFALAPEATALRALLARPGTEVIVAHVSGAAPNSEGGIQALRAVRASGLVDGLPLPELRSYQYAHYDQGVLAAAQDTQADLVVVLARQRSYAGELFGQSLTARLLAHCPVPVLVLPVVAPPVAPPGGVGTATRYAHAVLTGLVPVS